MHAERLEQRLQESASLRQDLTTAREKIAKLKVELQSSMSNGRQGQQILDASKGAQQEVNKADEAVLGELKDA